MEQEVEVNLFGLQCLSSDDGHILAVAVLVDCLDNSRPVPPWEEEVRIMAHAFPRCFMDNLFSFIVYVVDWRLLKFPFLVSEGMKH